MKRLKKLLIIFLTLSLCNFPLAAVASSIDYLNESAVQQKIDSLFTQMNELALEKRKLSLLKQNSALSVAEVSRLEHSIDTQRLSLLTQLENYGFNTIDADDPNDMALLKELIIGNLDTRSASTSSTIPPSPNLEAYADAYVIQHYEGTMSVNGVDYPYAFIYVNDTGEFEHSTLTVAKNITMHGQRSTVLSDFLAYQFSFGFSSFLGQIPYGWAADWLIGSVTSIFDSLSSNSIVNYISNTDIYNMTMISVTQMLYCYVYIPSGGWRLCGVKAPNISFSRTDTVAANVKGTAYSDAKVFDNVNSSTGIAIVSYVQNYVNNSMCRIDEIGSFTVEGCYNISTVFSPGFASNPAFLG